ncbi:MAG: hypothetical protein LBV69_09130 [Bacteroidales bacterium]|jgi:hypothetical protein|nr:hypothetical protein [Bacteroidales bacterium]
MKKLKDIEKKNNFKVPENYFENFNPHLNNYIDTRIDRKSKRTVFQIIKPYIYLAASFALFFFISTVVKYGIKKSELYSLNNDKKIEKKELISKENIFDKIIDDFNIYENINNTNLEIDYTETYTEYLSQNTFELDLIEYK